MRAGKSQRQVTVLSPRPASVSLTGSSLSILMEGVTSARGVGRPTAGPVRNVALEQHSGDPDVGRVQECRRAAWSSHVKSPSYQHPRLRAQTESQHLQKSF